MFKKCYLHSIHNVSSIVWRSFASKVAAFDVSMNPTKWPTNLKEMNCNDISIEHINKHVTLSGWVDSIRLMKDSVFIILRDGDGKVQTMFDCDKEVESILKQIPLESSVCIQGIVQLRPKNAINPKMKTGEIEIHGDKCFLLNAAKELPFQYHEKLPKDEILSKYRHLTLRHPEYLDELLFRSSFYYSIRNHMHDYGFKEIETPVLTRSSPEGAHELYVPTALIPRGGFALSQSPQQYKQILMASGIDKYYQIARCFRNECGRKDRQLEFTQLDFELSYITNISQITQIVENILTQTLHDLSYHGNIQFKEMEYSECMKKYGSDKPDLRIQQQLQEIQNTNENKVMNRMIHFPKMAGLVTNSKLKQIMKGIDGVNMKNLRIVRCSIDKELKIQYPKSIENLINIKEIIPSIESRLSYRCENDLILLGIEKKTTQQQNPYEIESLLGKLRTIVYSLGQEGKLFPSFEAIQLSSPITFLWVKHFPLFEYEKDGTLKASHHPFTAPLTVFTVEEMKQCENILSLQSSSCDLVLCGNEVGGGSLRIHNYELQKYIMQSILGITNLDVFSHLLNALKHGCPPHGGFAIGLDRLLSILRNRPSIRDVIAFPKTIVGSDPLTSSPSVISDEQWKEVGFSYVC